MKSSALIILGWVASAHALPYNVCTQKTVKASDYPAPTRDSECSNDDDIAHFWANLSPYYQQAAGLPAPPSQCHVSFVQVLSRHGSRFPLTPKVDSFKSLVARLQEALKDRPESSLGEYSFLKNYHYHLGAESLTALGEYELQESGKLFADSYRGLLEPLDTFVRASDIVDTGRVYRSAENFLKGLKAGETPILLMLEAPNISDPLWNYMCPAFSKSPNSDVVTTAMNKFRNTFAPQLTERLNEALKPFVFTDSDTINLMELCPYSTVSTSAGGKIEMSPVCALFSLEDWKNYEYLQTLYLQYGFGTSNPLGVTRGAPWVQELVARMTKKPILHDNTHYGGINMTLDGNNETFPLDKEVYLDFTHETDMISIYAAMGLFPEAKESLPADRRVCAEKAGGYTGSRVTPFGARMYVEKLSCQGENNTEQKANERVRVVVNGRVMKLAGCSADEFGTCLLGDWLKTLEFVLQGGDWNKCTARDLVFGS